jgi:hypothetical protein
METVLNAMDSLTVAPNEVREIINRENHVATYLFGPVDRGLDRFD